MLHNQVENWSLGTKDDGTGRQDFKVALINLAEIKRHKYKVD